MSLIVRFGTNCLKCSNILSPSSLTFKSLRSLTSHSKLCRPGQQTNIERIGLIFNQNVTLLMKNQNDVLTRARFISSRSGAKRHQRTTLIYICAIAIAMVGGAYAGVPLYRIFCQATGLGGQATQGHKVEEIDKLKKVDDKVLTIQFNADTASSMQWSFRPQQPEIRVVPGETALAFYTAKNPTDRPIVGISTYNVIPFEAGQYFNKIQCFCFEEQRLNPHEKVDMPVFFYIDPEIVDDPKCEHIRTIMLSYTFFEAKEGFEVPVPPYLREWRTAV